MSVLAQFPLGTVLFPTMVLPLHIFEPRYRALVNDVLADDRRFGVVMIERGLETGGEDQRSSFGTVARIIEAEELEDGRWALITVGTERFRVTEWLPDDPYPIADVEAWPDDDGVPLDSGEFDRVATKFRRCMALASEAGVDIGSLPEALEPCSVATMQMAAMLPIGTFDKQALLGAADPCERLRGLESAIDDAVELIELRLRGA